jgi:hypothetical protein
MDWRGDDAFYVGNVNYTPKHFVHKKYSKLQRVTVGLYCLILCFKSYMHSKTFEICIWLPLLLIHEIQLFSDHENATFIGQIFGANFALNIWWPILSFTSFFHFVLLYECISFKALIKMSKRFVKNKTHTKMSVYDYFQIFVVRLNWSLLHCVMINY